MRLNEMRPSSIFIDVCDADSLSGFFKALVREAMKSESGRICLMRLPEYRSWPVTEDPYDFNAFNMAFKSLIGNNTGLAVNRLIQNAFMALADSRIALLIDEFSVFL